jgi:two-component system copper resistance phosphate regulon response regulator CusR
MTALAASETLLFVGRNGARADDFPGALDVPDWRVERVDASVETIGALESVAAGAVIVFGWRADDDGLKLLSTIRSRWLALPIAIAGPSTSEEDLIRGLEAGADDYIVVPCSPREFAARIRAMIRRNTRGRGAFSVGDLEVWEESRVAFRSGRPIKLSAKEMEILLFLAANRSKPVSRQTLLRKVFNLSFEPGTNLVEVHIHRLREKIDIGHTRQLLRTVRGQGYVLGSWLCASLLAPSAEFLRAFSAI